MVCIPSRVEFVTVRQRAGRIARSCGRAPRGVMQTLASMRFFASRGGTPRHVCRCGTVLGLLPLHLPQNALGVRDVHEIEWAAHVANVRAAVRAAVVRRRIRVLMRGPACRQARRYDSRTTTFSPEGRLYQVEYAMEAISHAGICVGILAKDGIVLAVEKKITSKLLENISSEKMYKVNTIPWAFQRSFPTVRSVLGCSESVHQGMGLGRARGLVGHGYPARGSKCCVAVRKHTRAPLRFFASR
jgi:hypothetical protein